MMQNEDALELTDEDYGLADIHKKLLAALDELDHICRKNNIHYSLHGGTLLGAVRNQKLLAWDDDLDISMTRRNFDKFEQACQNLTGDYHLNEYDTWLPRFAVKNGDESIFIDIFIWDYISEDKLAQFIKINTLRFLQGTLKRNIKYSDYSIKNKILLKISHFLGMPFPRKTKLNFFRHYEQYAFQGKRKYIHRSNDAFLGVSYIFDSDYMHSYTTIPLEGKRYMVTKRYKEFLERNYGSDYMTPPPMSERKPLHEIQRKNFLEEE